METEPEPGRWKGPLVVLAIVVVLAAGALTLMGGQVSGVLSTVGASVGPPGPGSDGGVPVGEGAGEGEGDGNGSGDGSGDGSGSGSGGAPGRVPLLDISRPELLVIKTGEITIQVESIDRALAAATGTLDRLGGYASGSERNGTEADASAAATFRLPVRAWDEALIAVRGLGIKVLDEHSQSDDVTGTVVDIEARVRNLRTTEAALQAIMSRATAVDDVLTVQEELTTVRGEIEQLQSQAAHLREQAAMSTLTVYFSLKPEPVIARQESEFEPAAEVDQASAHLVGVLQALAKVGIWFAIVWLPILVALALVGAVGLFVARRLRRIRVEPLAGDAGGA